MEKEQIVKALECCIESGNCYECPNECGAGSMCVRKTMRDALSLIREQDKKIEELRCSSVDYREISYLLRDAQADTVRKMHDLIEERCIKGGIYPAFVKNTINKVAEELLEGGTEDEPAQP